MTKSLIAGVVYDTETATAVFEFKGPWKIRPNAHHSNPGYDSILYVTTKGAWFVVSTAGRNYGGGVRGTQDFYPLSVAEVMSLFEQKGGADVARQWLPDQVRDA